MIKRVQLLCDSGVFSSWNQGETLSIKDYIKYLKANKECLWAYVSMDVMPGKFGHRKTSAEVEISAGGSYKNHQVMKDAGLQPIPVFHQGERISWLEKYLADGEPYIGVSSSKEANTVGQINWLDQVFSLLTDQNGYPLVKVHGFGITKPRLLFRYPFFSCDSTTWSLNAGYGMFLVPGYKDGKPDYAQMPIPVLLSDRERTGSGTGRRFESLGAFGQDCVMRFLDENKVSLEDARYIPDARRQLLMLYYLRLGDQYKPGPFQNRTATFATPEVKPAKGKKGAELNIMLATCLNRSWSLQMNEVGANKRLLSYFELRKRSYDDLYEYVEKGVVGGDEFKPMKPKQKNWGEHYSSFRRGRLFKRFDLSVPVDIDEADVPWSTADQTDEIPF